MYAMTVMFSGLVWSTRPNDVETQIIMRSREMMQSLEEETGINSGWINNGGLFCATTRERLDEFKRMHTVSTQIQLQRLRNVEAPRACNQGWAPS